MVRASPSQSLVDLTSKKPSPSPHCDICVVTFNSEESVGRLLESIEQEKTVTSIRLLDNASQDQTVEAIRSVAARTVTLMDLYPSQSNIGFPAACNILLKECTADIVALVNPDIEFTPGALARLVRIVANDRSIGVATCRLMTRNEQPQSEAARSRPSLRRLLAGQVPRWISIAVRTHRERNGDSSLLLDRDVECLSGALMVFRCELLKDLGYLDESVFMYLEDIDFAARVRRAGYRIRYIGTTWVWHDSGISSRGNESKLYALLPKVWLTYMRRYGRVSERLAVRPILLIVCIIAAVNRLGHAKVPHGELLALWRVVSFRPTKDPTW
jgi:N-acetylglucosaminyl-diphospho-decaprenol L-rhamnosyltransferase